MFHGPAAAEAVAASDGEGGSSDADAAEIIMPNERRVVGSRRDLSEIAFRVSWWGYKVILVEVGRCESKDLRSPT